MDIYGTGKTPSSIGSNALTNFRVACFQDVIQYCPRNYARLHHIDVVVTPLTIDVQEVRPNAFEAIAQSNSQSIARNILWSHCNLNAVQLQSSQQVVSN
jgi:hypothetical protein